MIEIALNNIKKNFGFKNVLNGFDMELNTGECISLIGPNGSGKTTIFKIINGDEKPDSGDVIIRKGSTIGMLSQIPSNSDTNLTVTQVILKGKKNIFEIEKKLKNYENLMSNCKDNEELENILVSYGKLQEEYEKLGGYVLQSKLDKICSGFKISKDLLNRKYGTLSGGEKTIVSFASLIMSEPSILLLDEPTNHLDIETLEWLEQYLKNYNGTILISSHDRYFLDKVSNKTILIERGKSEIFFGNYSYYLKENERRVLSEFEDYKDQQKMIDAMKRKIKQLQEFGKLAFPGGEPFFRRAQSIQKRLDKIEVIEKPESKKDISLNFKMNDRSGNDVLKCNNLDLIIGDKILLDNAHFNINFGEKVCLMGRNGCGKSTLIKSILGLQDDIDYSGEIKLGSNVKVGYIPQEIKFEDESETVLDVSRKFFNGTETQLRSKLAKFLFYNDDVFKKVGSLSGGEKVKLKLLELIQKNSNFIILDEPTNHIDISTREILEEALQDYRGTLLFVSHDRYFINKISDKVLSMENNKIDSYIGNYDDYKQKISNLDTKDFPKTMSKKK